MAQSVYTYFGVEGLRCQAEPRSVEKSALVKIFYKKAMAEKISIVNTET